MGKRLMPTGHCWCGCGAQTDIGSFFAPGHDKRAESRVIMEVFGGVPQFLHALGYGPDQMADRAATSSSIELALRLARWGFMMTQAGPMPSAMFIIEYTDLANPQGPLLRT